jgi:hypothetical protein
MPDFDPLKVQRQRETLDRLRDEVEQTRALYESAKQEFQQALDRMAELGSTHPDGNIQHATKVYNHTLGYYQRAVEKFTRFMLDGKITEDKEELPRKPWGGNIRTWPFVVFAKLATGCSNGAKRRRETRTRAVKN